MSIVVLFFELLGNFASCLHCLRLFYNLFCVVVDSDEIVCGCQFCFHCFNLQQVVVGGCRLWFVSIVSCSFRSLQIVAPLRFFFQKKMFYLI